MSQLLNNPTISKMTENTVNFVLMVIFAPSIIVALLIARPKSKKIVAFLIECVIFLFVAMGLMTAQITMMAFVIPSAVMVYASIAVFGGASVGLVGTLIWTHYLRTKMNI
jgi:hypothetical protein